MPGVEELIAMDACRIVERLRAGELTPHDLLDALERRIARVEPAVNACPRSASSGPAPRRTPCCAARSRRGACSAACRCRSRT
jgi:hypothetical protein